MKILAFLQNQWFKDPERVKAMYDRHPEHRNDYIRAFLFMGCLTGRRLSAAFGDELCQQHIIWEEVSPEIGGHSSSKFPADYDHIITAVAKHDPGIILSFGKIASDAIHELATTPSKTGVLSPIRRIIYGPHPAARGADTMPQLRLMAEDLRRSMIDIDKLKAWQSSNIVHPFTCGSGNRTDPAHTDGEGVLVPTETGWACLFCEYRQPYRDLEVRISNESFWPQTYEELIAPAEVNEEKSC